MLAFSKLKRSNNTKLLLCKLMPYNTPELLVRSELTNGKLVDNGEELILVLTTSSSWPRGKVELKPCSAWKNAGLAYTNRPSNNTSTWDKMSSSSFSDLA